MKSLTAAFVAVLVVTSSAHSQDLPSVFLEELTWPEVRDAVDAGTTTIIIPTAGTEQNGPHMVLGKHKYIVNEAAAQIARELGRTLVAPVMTYVPEGDVNNPRGHLAKPGTITLPQEYFEKVMEYAARSLALHGFTDIVLIGDSGGNQAGMRNVAQMLNAEWRDGPARVHFVAEYYAGGGGGRFDDWLMEQGETEEAIGTHAGITDTSQLLAIAPQHVRTDKLAPGGGFADSGVNGDPSRSTVEYGLMGLRLKVDATVRVVRERLAAR